jgi:hypothetical protein
MALAITRTELSPEELRGAARRSADGDQACRLVALALVLEGASRTAAARERITVGKDEIAIALLAIYIPRNAVEWATHKQGFIDATNWKCAG